MQKKVSFITLPRIKSIPATQSISNIAVAIREYALNIIHWPMS